ncbi:MAG: GNAT family N-acetyltransferase [Methyloprofundus sp.]|nr:GNAT family N-acetyltransferase [Methyloprofundus sp.]
MSLDFNKDLSLRPIKANDLAFLADVYASTRIDEVALMPWAETEKKAFLQMQFEAQHQHYQLHYADASFDIIEYQGLAIGRFYVHRSATEIRIVDISLLASHRGLGIGTYLMTSLFDEAKNHDISIRIHVESMNPALHLYERLGFHRVTENGLYFLLEYKPLN